MSHLSILFAAIKVDVNKEESIIINQINRLLRKMFQLIILFGIPYVLYLLFQFVQ